MKSVETRQNRYTMRMITGTVAAVALAGCTPSEEEARIERKPGIESSEVSSVRELPAPADRLETEYTRASACGVEAAKIAIDSVLAADTSGELVPGVHMSDVDNHKSSYVRVEHLAEGTAKLTLEVILATDGIVNSASRNEPGFSVRGQMTMMQAEGESWQDALHELRTDQAGFPSHGIAVWDLSSNEGGTTSQPQAICEATEALKQARSK